MHIINQILFMSGAGQLITAHIHINPYSGVRQKYSGTGQAVTQSTYFLPDNPIGT